MKDHSFNAPAYQKRLHIAWQHFIKNEDYDYSFMNADILHSWERSRAAKVDPFGIVNKILTPDELNLKINNNMKLIEVAHPYMERLYSFIKETNSYILLSDKAGYILDYLGDNEIVIGGQLMTRLVPGACRQETVAGTNAIGTALYLRKPIQLWGNEHYCEKHQLYTCSCAPIFDSSSNIIGAINITVLKEHAHPHTLGMVLSASDSIAKEIELTSAMQSIERISAQRNTIIENMPSGLFLLTKSCRISQVNKYALKLLGLSYEQVIGKNLFDYIGIDDNISYDSNCAFLEKERYNEEASVSLLHVAMPPKKFRLSVHFIKANTGDITGTLLRFNETELIHKLVKNVGGYSAHYSFDSIIGNSEPVKQMIQASKKAAENDSNVLILGESGTGKELIAQSIHNASASVNGPFIAINCASIPNSLVESELFGYEKGAFTGADKNGRPGKFEMAHGGTIFLDEIGDMPLDIQAALLRVIQTKEVVRIGGKYPKSVDIRIIAATNQDLLQSIENKTFRSDLYYRLNVFTINTPSLADRGAGDIRILADHFVRVHNRDKGPNIRISPDVYPLLQSYAWPGNVRQLENVIERAINLVEKDGLITVNQLPEDIRRASAKIPLHKGQRHSSLLEPIPASVPDVLNVKENEKKLIVSALEKTGGNMTKTAKIIDMNLRTLYRKLDKYQIRPSDYRK
ncbi:sigma-54-dependent Fis family transcriptional regulator [Anaerovorax odorimutans]|nr:sigma 54-interacting transcriptional regulator [Anaerovorax odorimutans]